MKVIVLSVYQSLTFFPKDNKYIYSILQYSLCELERNLIQIPFSFQYPRWESNPYFRFRKPTFYPLNYKGCCFELTQKYYNNLENARSGRF